MNQLRIAPTRPCRHKLFDHEIDDDGASAYSNISCGVFWQKDVETMRGWVVRTAVRTGDQELIPWFNDWITAGGTPSDCRTSSGR